MFKIRYTSRYVSKLLEGRCDADNLWGILEVLQIYGIIVEPYKITNLTPSSKLNIDKPFITEYNNNILLIKQITDKEVLGCLNGKDKTYNKDEFLSNWNGITVYVFKGESVGEPNIDRHIRNIQLERGAGIAIILSILTLCVCRMAVFNIPFSVILIFLLSTLGAIVSYQIELSNFSYNSLFNNFCSFFKHSSCHQIKSRKNSYITAFGFSYFCSLCIFILLPLENYAVTYCMAAISLVEVIWSLVLQVSRKMFCIKCFSIQVILSVMALIGIFNLKGLYLPVLILQGVVLLSIFTIILYITLLQLWPYVKTHHNILRKGKLMDYFKKQYLDHSISNGNSITTIFLNPFCNPCREEILKSYNLLINHKDSNVVPIVIVSDPNGEKIGKYIIGGLSSSSIFHRLKEWYSWGYLNPSEFEKIYCISSEEEIKLSNVLKDNLNLAHMYNVQHTPSIIYDGRKQPDGISLIDVLIHSMK